MSSALDLLNKGDAGLAAFFLLEIDGLEVGVFREVKGLEMTMTTVDIPEGGQNTHMHKVPGRTTWSNVTLKRGITHGDVLTEWLNKFAGARYNATKSSLTKDGYKRGTGALTALSEHYVRLRAWNFTGVMPVKWKGPDFSIENKSTLEEELEFSHSGFYTETFAAAKATAALNSGTPK